MRRNPFRARNLSPGRLPYFFPLGHDVAQLLQRLRENKLRGQIVGPHGSGKSTLLIHLVNELEKAGCQVESVWLEPNNVEARNTSRQQLRDLVTREESDASADSDPRGDWEAHGDAKRIIAVDGLETLSWLDRKRFLRLTRQNEWGVLVTAHRDLGLPTLWETQVDLERAQKVIAALLRRQQTEAGQNADSLFSDVPLELVSGLLDRHQGDLREVLFGLYDWYQDAV